MSTSEQDMCDIRGRATYVMLTPSMTVMYACAVLKLHGPDSHSTP